MRVAILAPDLAGGGMTRAYWIAQVLLAAGYRARIHGPLPAGLLPYPEPPPGIELVPTPGDDFPALARATAEGAQADLLYALKPRRTSFGVGLRASEALGCPLVLDVDDVQYGAFEGFAAPLSGRVARALWHPLDAARALRRRISRSLRSSLSLDGRCLARSTGRAHALTVNSGFLQARHGGTLLPSGKDTALFDPALHDPERSRARLGLGGRRVLMFPGTPQPYKGLEDLLAALDSVGRADLRLALVGGRTTDFGERLARQWPRWVVRLPRFPLAEMPSVVAAAHVVVVPQRDTPFARAQSPMKLGDGMAMAKPVLATRVGEIPRILGDTGYLVAPSSPAELAASLQDILDDEAEAARRGAAARVRCSELFGLAPCARILGRVLQEVTSR